MTPQLSDILIAREGAEAMAREAYEAREAALVLLAGYPRGVAFDAPGWEVYTRAEIAAHLTLLCDLRREQPRAWWLARLAEREGKDASRGVTFDRGDRWDGGAYYVLSTICPPDCGALYDPTVYYASESVERLLSVAAAVILPELADGPDEPEALRRICLARLSPMKEGATP